VKGRQHPVKIFHTAVSQTDYVDAALRCFFQIHTDKPPGDVLIFLPGSFVILNLPPSSFLTIFVHRPRGHRKLIRIHQTVCKQTASRSHGCTTFNSIIRHRSDTELPGTHIPYVRVTSARTTSKHLFGNVNRHSQMYIGYQHCRDVDHNPWD
jgi:hypothetical protein